MVSSARRRLISTFRRKADVNATCSFVVLAGMSRTQVGHRGQGWIDLLGLVCQADRGE